MNNTIEGKLRKCLLEKKAWMDAAEYFEYVSRNKSDGDDYDYDQCSRLKSLIASIVMADRRRSTYTFGRSAYKRPNIVSSTIAMRGLS